MQHDSWTWQTLTGPSPRVGTTSLATTDVVYDGGGISTYCLITAVLIWNPVNEPDARWEATWTNATWLNHSARWPYSAWGAYPALPDKNTHVDINLVDSTIEDSAGVNAAGTAWDGNQLHLFTVVGTIHAKGCRFVRGSCDGTDGGGGARMMPPSAGDLMPVLLFEDDLWHGNVAGSGPAVFVQFGQVDLQFHNCIFVDNIAYNSGGAIAVQGNDKLVVTILQSEFDANAVRPPQDAGAVDVTVRLNTGGFPIDLTTDLTDYRVDAFIPIWRIDDGPVHGTSSI